MSGFVRSMLRNPGGLIGLVVLVLVILIAILGPLAFPNSPWRMVQRPFLPPFTLSAVPLGTDALGRLDAGLFFIAYVRDPIKHYVPMQNQLSSKDGLMEYLQHTGSGLWAVPPGVRKGEYVGQALFS